MDPEDELMLQQMVAGGAFMQRVTQTGHSDEDSEEDQKRLAPPKVCLAQFGQAYKHTITCNVQRAWMSRRECSF